MEFASRLNELESSATFRYSALAKKEGIIDLTIGRTNFDTPSVIKNAAKRALDDGKVQYTPTNGIPELREKISEKLEKENRISGLNSENVLVSTGAKQIIFEAVMALIDRGDVVAIPNPSWVSYEQIVKLVEGNVLWLPLKAENGFIPDDEFFSVLENSNPRLILMNSPNNPTGAVYPENIIRKIVDIAERKDSWILSDEIYEKIIYEGRHFSPGRIYPRTITVNGFSKEFSMTGWRLGYCACSNLEMIDKMNLIQSQSVSCTVSFAQFGALAAFTPEAQKETEKMRRELKKRRDLLMNGMENINAIHDRAKLGRVSDHRSATCSKPAGTFYVFPFFGGDDVEYADRLLRGGVGVIPGSPFGSSGRGCVRISYGAASLDELEKAMDRIKDLER